jgi:putative membrane-bound dehydrogenase-like protein
VKGICAADKPGREPNSVDFRFKPRQNASMNLLSRTGSCWLTFLASTSIAYEHGAPPPEDFEMPAPLTLAESLASFEVAEGWKLELIAAEPMVLDPIFLDFGEDGKVWVVEMADYPLGLTGNNDPGGRVRFLEDSTGDGKFDRSTLFLDGLNFPTGVKAWRSGAIVIAAPEIFYAEDTDGDGVADKREVLFQGFREGNQQHRVNGLWDGGDGWLYLANGDSGGEIESIKTGEKIDLGNFDLRIKPDTGEMERVTGRSQFGRARDSLGNWYGCNNSKPLFQFVLEDSDLRRNPHVEFPNPVHQVPEDPYAPRVFPISKPALRYNDPHAASRITSACGLAIENDIAYVCEPVHNLVHRQQLLKGGGVARTSRRLESEADSEFLRSSDSWFRPTSVRFDADGAAWITDMHRFVIEHPEWIPEPWQKVLDLRAGADRGRIYRVVPPEPSSTPVERSPEIPLLVLAQSSWTSGENFANFALENSEDPYLLAAAMTGLIPHLDAVVDTAIEDKSPALDRLMPYLIATALGEKNEAAVERLLDTDRFSAWAALFAKPVKLSPEIQARVDAANAIIERARTQAKSGDAAAIQLLARRKSDLQADTELLLSFLGPQHPDKLQKAAVRRLRDLGAGEQLLAGWSGFLPELRRSVLAACLEDRDLATKLLDAIEGSAIDPLSIDAASRDRLTRYPNSAVRVRAKGLLANLANADRAAVIEKFRPALELEGDIARGREQFTLLCSACHKIGEIGRTLGADLNALRDRSGEAMLISIFDPNRAVEDKFIVQTLELSDGRSVVGMIQGEVGESVVVQLLDGSTQTIQRAEIASLKNSGRSAMPDGIEAALDPQKLADLIAFLQSANPTN